MKKLQQYEIIYKHVKFSKEAVWRLHESKLYLFVSWIIFMLHETELEKYYVSLSVLKRV